MPKTTLKDGSQQVPGTRGCQAFSSGLQPIQKNRAPSPKRIFMVTMVSKRKAHIQPSEVLSSVIAKDVLLHDWLTIATVVEHIPSVTMVLIVSTEIGDVSSAVAMLNIMVIITQLLNKAT